MPRDDWPCGVAVASFVGMNQVTLHRARLVQVWVTHKSDLVNMSPSQLGQLSLASPVVAKSSTGLRWVG